MANPNRSSRAIDMENASERYYVLPSAERPERAEHMRRSGRQNTWSRLRRPQDLDMSLRTGASCPRTKKEGVTNRNLATKEPNRNPVSEPSGHHL